MRPDTRRIGWRLWCLWALCIVALLSPLWLPSCAQAAEFGERVCEARVVADFKPRLTEREWLEVADAMEGSGAYPADDAARLRALIVRIYRLDGQALDDYVRDACRA